jgi:hypothetical protein
MGEFYMNREYIKGARHKIAKKVSNFEDHAKNFHSDKTVHFFNLRSHAAYSAIVTSLNRYIVKSTIDQKPNSDRKHQNLEFFNLKFENLC